MHEICAMELAAYVLNVNILVSFDHHSNIISAALGLEALLPSKKGSAINAIAVHWNHAGAT